MCGFVYKKRNMLHLLCDPKHSAGSFMSLLEFGYTGQAEVIRAIFELFAQVVDTINVDHDSTLFAAWLLRRCDFFEKAWGANPGIFMFIKTHPLLRLPALRASCFSFSCIVNLRYESFGHPRLPNKDMGVGTAGSII